MFSNFLRIGENMKLNVFVIILILITFILMYEGSESALLSATITVGAILFDLWREYE